MTLTFSSHLPMSPDALWQQISTMQGVNEELSPWLHMSFPESARDFILDERAVGVPLFTSTIRFLGILPYDRHQLQLIEVIPGEGFLEESSSWTMRRWRHERRLKCEGAGTRITDHLTFEPRMPGIQWLVKILITAVFRHRHANLRKNLLI